MKGQPMHDPVDVSPMDVRGSVRVELFDDRTGKLVERQDGENFVSVDMKETMRWWQRLTFGQFSPGTAVGDANGVLPYYMPRQPTDHIAYWTDDAAEAPSTEHLVSGEVVGWASRWPVGSPTGKRGVVDVGASVNGPGYSTWVFNWTNSQGVGTFQSVGWTRLVEANAMPIPRFPDPDIATVAFTAVDAQTTNTKGPDYGSAWWDPVESKWLTFSGNSDTLGRYCAAYYPETGGTRSSYQDLAGTATAALTGIVRIGTDYAVAHENGSVERFTSAGARSWISASLGLASGARLTGLTIDGAGKLWTCSLNGTLRRHSPTDGTVEVTVTPWRTPTLLSGIAYDSVADRLWLAGNWSAQWGIARVDTDGTLSGPTFGFAATQTVTASAPFSSYVVNGVNTFDNWSIGRSSTVGNLVGPTLAADFTAGNVTSIGNTAGKWGAGIACKAGQLYLLQQRSHLANGQNRMGLATARPLVGHTLGTRVRLSSPVTKTNAQNLRITYRFDFA